MNKEYKVRPYRLGDEEEIVELLQLVLGGWPHFDLDCTPLEHWRWKYLDRLSMKKTVVVALSDDKIVGCLHDGCHKIKAGDTIVLGDQGTDLAVHPDFRRMGIYNKMDEYFDDLNLSFSVSGNPIVYKKAMRSGDRRFPYHISFMTLIKDIDMHFDNVESKHSFLKKYGFKSLKGFYKLYRLTKQRIPSKNLKLGINIHSITRFNEEINEFWEDIYNYYDFILVRDQDYLNWRYADTRGGKYHIKIAKIKNKIVGYIVLRINRYKSNYHIGYILDLLASPSVSRVEIALLNDAINYFDELGINQVDYRSVKDSVYNKTAKSFGFLEIPNKFMIWSDKRSSLNIENIQISSPDHIHFCYGDTDII